MNMIARLTGLLLLLAVNVVTAQEIDRMYGVFGDYALVRHDADIPGIPGIPNCCSRFEQGSGVGIAIGGLYEGSLGGLFGFSLRAGFASSTTELSAMEESRIAVGGVEMPAIFEHRIETRVSSIGIEPHLLYDLFGGFRLHAGARIAMVTRGEFEQREQIVEPYEIGSFSDGSRVRNEYSGEIPGGSTMERSLLAGISRELPLDRQGRMILAPELFCSYDLAPVASGLDWNASALRLGAALKIGFISEPDPMPAPVPTAPEPAVERRPILAAALRAVSVEADGSEREEVKIRYEEFVSVHLRPLLNYLFFDEGSDRIPSRYTALDRAGAERFEVENLHDVETLPTYYHLLNIVGRRLRKHPEATITLVGCNRDEGIEAGNTALSAGRAARLFEYLRDVWGIDSSRMRIEVRNLPAKPSNIDKEDGDVENRRVEIGSDTWAIIEPVLTNDTLRDGAPPTLRFYQQATAEAGVARWRLGVRQGERTVREFEGEGAPPSVVEWDIRREIGRSISSSEPLRYTLELVDATGATVRTTPGEIPVEAITIQKKRRERIADRYIDRYALILFDFDKGDLNAANRTIGRFVRERIASGATTTISGYTDRMGEEDHNLALSRARALSTATALGVESERATGFGESAPLFDNDLPEGRHYSRTVNVVVETPVKVE